MAEAGFDGCISATDTKCLCNNPTFVSETSICVEETCQGADLESAISIGESVCLAAVRLILFYFQFDSQVTHVFSCFVGRHFVCLHGDPYQRFSPCHHFQLESRCCTPRQLEQFHRPCSCRPSDPRYLLTISPLSRFYVFYVLRIKPKLVTPPYSNLFVFVWFELFGSSEIDLCIIILNICLLNARKCHFRLIYMSIIGHPERR